MDDYLFPGGHREFHRRHRELCEDTLLPNGTATATDPSTTTTVSGCTSPGPGCPVLSVSGPPTPQPADIDNHPASRVLPFLYLGNGRDAADLQLLRALGATRVLNVTSQLPGYHEERGITYRQIPASDSGHQNLKQYFEEAFDFIGECGEICTYLNKLFPSSGGLGISFECWWQFFYIDCRKYFFYSENNSSFKNPCKESYRRDCLV